MQLTYVSFAVFIRNRMNLAGVAGFEPAIFGLGGRCIIQLCYTPSVAKTPPMMEVTVVVLLQIHATFAQLECVPGMIAEGEHHNPIVRRERWLVGPPEG